MPNGKVETHPVKNITGDNIEIDSVFSTIPNQNSVWLLQDDGNEAQRYRVISVEENDGINYAITALSYVDDKYNFIEDDEEETEQD